MFYCTVPVIDNFFLRRAKCKLCKSANASNFCTPPLPSYYTYLLLLPPTPCGLILKSLFPHVPSRHQTRDTTVSFIIFHTNETTGQPGQKNKKNLPVKFGFFQNHLSDAVQISRFVFKFKIDIHPCFWVFFVGVG